MNENKGNGKRKDRTARRTSPIKRQKSVQGVDDVDGLPPGFGFTKSTARARKCNRRVCHMDTSYVNNTSNSASGNSGPFCWPRTPTRAVFTCYPSLSSDCSVEEDGINATQTSTKRVDASSLDVSDSFASVKPADLPAKRSLFRKKKPDFQTKLLIHHPEETDTPLGDYFGADLVSFCDPKRNYVQHLLRKITPDGVAKNMHFEADDELVLLNDTFVPNMEHVDVLNLFHNIPVDGHTKLSFVFRRVDKTKWQWYLTSAILCPVGREHTHHMKDKKFKDLVRNQYTNEQMVKVRCPITGQYLDIQDSAISVGPLLNDHVTDRSKIIRQTTIYFEDDQGNPTWQATLRGTVGTCPYIGVSMINEAEPISDKVWYGIRQSSGSVSFRHKDSYLATERHRVVTRATEYFFVVFPNREEDGYDELDGRPSSQWSQSSSFSTSGESSGYGSFTDTVSMETSIKTRSQMKSGTVKTPTTPLARLSFL